MSSRLSGVDVARMSAMEEDPDDGVLSLCVPRSSVGASAASSGDVLVAFDARSTHSPSEAAESHGATRSARRIPKQRMPAASLIPNRVWAHRFRKRYGWDGDNNSTRQGRAWATTTRPWSAPGIIPPLEGWHKDQRRGVAAIGAGADSLSIET